MADGYGKNVLREREKQERTGTTTVYRDKGSRKRGKVESNRVASTDLRETRMHEDAAAIGICCYYKVCKWRRAQNTALEFQHGRGPSSASLLFPTIIN